MKKIFILLLINICWLSILHAEPVKESTPQISLFESMERVKLFLKNEAKYDYSDKYLSSVSLHYLDGHPKKGLAWVYSFSFKKPRMGGSISIFHYMSGEVIEFYHGP